MTQISHAHMISLWEDNKYCLEPKEFMSLNFWLREQYKRESILQQFKIILKALNMEHILMVEEELDCKE